jgi:putative acetyltransferase
MKPHPLDPWSPGAQHLLALSDAYLASLYPAESNHLTSPQTLALPHVWFIGITLGDQVVACGAVKRMQDDGEYGEVKRVFVLPTHRGRGLSKTILEALEDHLTTHAIGWVRLETGIHQPEALNLYRSLGYRERLPFGAYRPDPLSVFMEKRLSPSYHS